MPDLVTEIHDRVHRLMRDGLTPTALEVGWEEYGQLRRFLSTEPDAARPRSVLDLPIVLIDSARHLRVVALDRRR